MLAAFHAGARRDAEITAEGGREALRARWTDSFRARWTDSFKELRRFPGTVLDDTLVAELERRAVCFLDGRAPLLAARQRAGRIVDGHGDLLTGDIFIPDDGPRVLDCLEFDDRLRYLDGLDDAAFLAMDLEYRGAAELGARFLDWYAEFAGDPAPHQSTAAPHQQGLYSQPPPSAPTPNCSPAPGALPSPGRIARPGRLLDPRHPPRSRRRTGPPRTRRTHRAAMHGTTRGGRPATTGTHRVHLRCRRGNQPCPGSPRRPLTTGLAHRHRRIRARRRHHGIPPRDQGRVLITGAAEVITSPVQIQAQYRLRQDHFRAAGEFVTCAVPSRASRRTSSVPLPLQLRDWTSRPTHRPSSTTGRCRTPAVACAVHRQCRRTVGTGTLRCGARFGGCPIVGR